MIYANNSPTGRPLYSLMQSKIYILISFLITLHTSRVEWLFKAILTWEVGTRLAPLLSHAILWSQLYGVAKRPNKMNDRFELHVAISTLKVVNGCGAYETALAYLMDRHSQYSLPILPKTGTDFPNIFKHSSIQLSCYCSRKYRKIIATTLCN